MRARIMIAINTEVVWISSEHFSLSPIRKQVRQHVCLEYSRQCGGF